MTAVITAIICTHDRDDLLERAIDSLSRQSLDRARYEILVVDNASTDGTRDLVRRKMQETPNLAYEHEPRLGLSIARNTGIRRAEGRYVAFLDDDAIARPDWLERIVRAFEEVEPQPGVVAGKVEPLWGAPRPAWLEDEFLGPLSVIDWSDHPRELQEGEWVVGANVAFPRELLRECGGFAEDLGRRGSGLLSDEETAVARLIRRRGRPIHYDPEIVVQHTIHPERLSKRWLYRRVFWGGVSAGMVARGNTPKPAARRKFVLKHLRRIGPLGLRDIAVPANTTPRVRRKFRTLRSAGMLYGFLFRAPPEPSNSYPK